MSSSTAPRREILAPGRRLTPKRGRDFSVRLTSDRRICVAQPRQEPPHPTRSRTAGTVVAVLEGPAWSPAIGKVAQVWNWLSNELDRHAEHVSQPKFHITMDPRRPQLKLTARADGSYAQTVSLAAATDPAQWNAAATLLAANLLAHVASEDAVRPEVLERLVTMRRHLDPAPPVLPQTPAASHA